MSLFERIKNKRYDLQEVKKKMGGGSNSSSDNNVKTNTNKNPNETIFGDPPKKEKKFNNNTNNNVPPKNEKPLTKHQKARQQVIQKRTQYGLKPDSRGVYKPTKSGLKSSLTNQIKYSSTPPKPGAKKSAEALKKFNQQMRKSQKYSGNENAARVKKIVDRVAKNQKIDKSKSGLVKRMKDIAYGKNPYKKVFGSTALNMQKKYDTQMLNYGGRMSPLMTQKQIEALKKKIASKPAEKTMTYFAPAGSGKPVPLKTRSIKKIAAPEIEKIIPKGNPRVTTSTYNYVAPPPKVTQLSKLSKHLMKRKNIYATGAGLALAGGLYLRNRNKNKQREAKKLALLNVQKEKDKIQPMDVSLFLNRTGTSPNKVVDKSKQFTPSPYAYRPKNQPKPTYAKPTQYGSFDSKTKRMVQTTKKPKNINKNLP